TLNIKGERFPAPLWCDLNLNYFRYFRTASSSCSAATMSLRIRMAISTRLIRVSCGSGALPADVPFRCLLPAVVHAVSQGETLCLLTNNRRLTRGYGADGTTRFSQELVRRVTMRPPHNTLRTVIL